MHMIWHMYRIAQTNIYIEGVRVLKSPNEKWGELFNLDGDSEGFQESLGQGDGVLFLEEAHEALNKLSQKTNKRGRLMKQPRRAESWQ